MPRVFCVRNKTGVSQRQSSILVSNSCVTPNVTSAKENLTTYQRHLNRSLIQQIFRSKTLQPSVQTTSYSGNAPDWRHTTEIRRAGAEANS